MLKCSHGLPLEIRCAQCTQEALSRPSCWTTYWIAGQACTKPADVSKRCVGCAYYVEGMQA